jgi:hypothetical protein
MDEKILNIVIALQAAYQEIEKLRETPGTIDGRSVSVALTHLDTTLLWLANARK